jgi:hypothetical protein
VPSIIPSILTSFLVPADGKTSPQHDAATTMLHCGDVDPQGNDVLGVCQTWPKSSILVSSDQSTFFHMFGESLACLLADTTPQFFFNFLWLPSR